jgi:hypothetical protein
MIRIGGYHCAHPRARCQRLHGSLPSSRNGFNSRRPLIVAEHAGGSLTAVIIAPTTGSGAVW